MTDEAQQDRCEECGAPTNGPDNCAARFAALLALDHSRTEPWGSRHGLAFAAYTLQHPSNQSESTLERCWLMLYRVFVAGDETADVARGMRALQSGQSFWDPCPLPSREQVTTTYSTTIADLGSFAAREYPMMLDDWCRATLAGWGQTEVGW